MMTPSSNSPKGAFALILDEHDRVLLSHRRDKDLWNLPGGCIEPMESPWNAVIREVQEETGLLVAITRLQGLYYKPRTDEIVFSFVCQIVGGTLTTTSEADEHTYFPASALPQNISIRQRDRILDFFTERDTVYMRSQP